MVIMTKYIEIKSTLKERLLFLLFSLLREELINKIPKNNDVTFKEYTKEIKSEVIPFFDNIDTSVKSRLK